MAGLLSFLSDISVQASGQPTGPLGPLGENDYGTSTYRYPSDLGSSDKGHYMIIQVLEQSETQFAGSSVGTQGAKFGNDAGTQQLISGVANLIGNTASEIQKIIPTVLTNIFNSVKNAKLTQDILNTPGGEFVVGVGEGSGGYLKKSYNKLKIGSVRATTKIKSSIALYMPDTLNFDFTQHYSTPSMTDSLAGNVAAFGGAAGKSTVDALMNKNLSAKDKGYIFGHNMSPFIANYAAKQAGGFGQIAFAAATGTVQNPMIEMIYSAPDFRTFRFDFMFYPRSQKEGREVQNIIRTLRFHQAPESQKSTNGYFLIPPSEFDIRFFYRGTENPNIQKIGVCVLESINVNYAPNGFSAYEVPNQPGTLGGTGMPVAIQLSLQFKETEIRTKNSYKIEDRLNYDTTHSPFGDSQGGPLVPSPFGDRQGK